MRGNLVWNISAFVPSKAGLTKKVVPSKGNLIWNISALVFSKVDLTKEVVFHEGGPSTEVLLSN